MRGFPKVLNSKEDYQIIQQMALDGKVSVDKTRQALESLKNTEKAYFFDRVLGESESADGAEPDFRVMDVDNEGTTERHQFSLQTDPNSRLVRLGFTVSEIDQLIDELN